MKTFNYMCSHWDLSLASQSLQGKELSNYEYPWEDPECVGLSGKIYLCDHLTHTHTQTVKMFIKWNKELAPKGLIPCNFSLFA